LARASAQALKSVVEECWTLVGNRRGNIWLARCIDHRHGEFASVHFDGPGVLDREERRRDVLGFFHTHPSGPPLPSSRDIRTMRAWCSAFGKPLLCVIASPGSLAGFLFGDDSSTGIPLAQIELFPRGVLIGVQTDG
jgi:proteasome lid subunit RPN8/RPN11